MLSFSVTEEQGQLVSAVRRFTKERIIPVAAACDEEESFPHDVYKEAFELGLIAPVIPPEYGGIGANELDHVLIAEELAYGCTGIQTSIGCSTLAAMPVLLAGSEEQKKKYLGQLTSEASYASYAITEPGAGSDAAALVTRAVQHGDDWVLNGQKIYITNGSWGTGVAEVDPSRHKGIMAFLVDRDTPGVSGQRGKRIGQRASDTATIVFEDVKVPKSQVLAGEGEASSWRCRRLMDPPRYRGCGLWSYAACT